jgi:hypothetical protein
MPIELENGNWEASSYRGRVVVRASGVKTRFQPGTGVKAPPWKRPALVKAAIIEDARYEDEGPTEVLFPTL